MFFYKERKRTQRSERFEKNGCPTLLFSTYDLPRVPQEANILNRGGEGEGERGGNVHECGLIPPPYVSGSQILIQFLHITANHSITNINTGYCGNGKTANKHEKFLIFCRRKGSTVESEHIILTKNIKQKYITGKFLLLKICAVWKLTIHHKK